MSSNQKSSRIISFSESLNEALFQAMRSDPNVVIIGEGVPDNNAIFNTTKGLAEAFGKSRVYDMPLSENGVTGVCIGASQRGLKPILVHQRLDFSLLSLDQVINNAAKLKYIFNGLVNIPIVIRMIVGRGWGQGPQHSQNLHALFALINGLKVITPSNAYNAKGLMLSAIKENCPVVFIEHRWLHNTTSFVPKKSYLCNIGQPIIAKKGNALTLCTYSFSVIQALKMHNTFDKFFNIKIEIVDLISLNPLNIKPLLKSLQKTNLLVFLDTATNNETIGHKVISRIISKDISLLKKSPMLICTPDHPAPTSHHLMVNYYIDDIALFKKIALYLDVKNKAQIKAAISSLKTDLPHDVPDQNFKGPF